MSSGNRRRVVIPAGTLSPGKSNVIEIPASASTSNIVVATKPKGGDSECDIECSAEQDASRLQRSQRSSPGNSSQRPGSPSRSQRSSREPAGNHSVTTVGPDLDELELREQRNFKDDLREFQEARKKLFTDVLTLHAANEKENST